MVTIVAPHTPHTPRPTKTANDNKQGKDMDTDPAVIYLRVILKR